MSPCLVQFMFIKVDVYSCWMYLSCNCYKTPTFGNHIPQGGGGTIMMCACWGILNCAFPDRPLFLRRSAFLGIIGFPSRPAHWRITRFPGRSEQMRNTYSRTACHWGSRLSFAYNGMCINISVETYGHILNIPCMRSYPPISFAFVDLFSTICAPSIHRHSL